MARINGELEQKDSEQTKHREALSKIESELLSCKERVKEDEGYLQAKELELKEIETEFEQFRDELASLKMNSKLLR